MIGFTARDEDRRQLEALAVPPEALRDDGRDYNGIVVLKPWGHEVQLRGTPEYTATVLELQADAETSMHCHPGKTVLLVVRRGAIRVERLSSHLHLYEGQIALLERGVFHRLRAGHAPARVLEIEWPPNKNDIVRLADVHGRTGKAYAAGTLP